MVNTGFTGSLLDRYLANGWYRMGARMFTCRYNFYDWGFLTTVWTRLPLAGYAPGKRVRKLLRRNARDLRYEVHPARAEAAEEAVFARYSASKTYDLHGEAADYLRHNPDSPFDTWQVSVYAGERLVAFSYFDLGRYAAQSVCGFYLPEAERYSPGLYTLVLEAEYCRDRGMHYHYAGYIVPGNDIFEYKRRVGPLEAFDDLLRVWYPIEKLNEEALPDAQQRMALLAYDELMDEVGLGYTVRMRPQYFVSIAQQDLHWLRREQLPFCVTEAFSNRRPYWACHFYSFNRRRFFSLLCTSHAYEQEHEQVPQRMRQRPPRSKRFEHLGSGVAVRLLHSTRRPYKRADLERVWAQVAEANEAAYG